MDRKIIPKCMVSNNETVYFVSNVFSGNDTTTKQIALAKSNSFPFPSNGTDDIKWTMVSLTNATNVAPFILPGQNDTNYDTEIACVVDDNGVFTMSSFQLNPGPYQPIPNIARTIQYDPSRNQWVHLDDLTIRDRTGDLRLYNIKNPSSNEITLYQMRVLPVGYYVNEQREIRFGPLTSDGQSEINSRIFHLDTPLLGLDETFISNNSLYVWNTNKTQSLATYPLKFPVPSGIVNKSAIIPWNSTCVSGGTIFTSHNDSLYINCQSGLPDFFDYVYIINEKEIRSWRYQGTFDAANRESITPMPSKDPARQAVFFRKFATLSYRILTGGGSEEQFISDYRIKMPEYSIYTPIETSKVIDDNKCMESCTFGRQLVVLIVSVMAAVILVCFGCGCFCYRRKRNRRFRKKKELEAAAANNIQMMLPGNTSDTKINEKQQINRSSS